MELPTTNLDLNLGEAAVVEEDHEALSDQILLLIFLLLVSSWLSALLRKCSKNQGSFHVPIINDQLIALVIGLITGLIIQNPPIQHNSVKKMQNHLKQKQKELVYELSGDLVLLYSVLIVPPIIYENALCLVKRLRVFTRLGTVILYTFIEVLLLLALFILASFVLGDMNTIVLIGLVIQLNDYSAVLEPHVSFALNNEDTLGFVGFQALFKNLCVIFVLVNMLPDTRSQSDKASDQILYGLYQLVMPALISLVINVTTTLSMKQQGKYQQIAEQFTNFDIALFLTTPILAYLVGEASCCSGLNTLICTGLFQSIYTSQNLAGWKFEFIASTIRYIGFLHRQVAFIVMGIIMPFYLERAEGGVLTVMFYVSLIFAAQISITCVITWYLLPTVCDSTEMKIMIIKGCSQAGILTFSMSFATKNDKVINIALAYVSMCMGLNQIVSAYLIQKKDILKTEDKKPNSDELEDQRSRDSAFKRWIVDLHLDKIQPCLVRQNGADQAPPTLLTQRSEFSQVGQGDDDDDIGAYHHQRDTRQNYYQSTADNTSQSQSLMNATDQTDTSVELTQFE